MGPFYVECHSVGCLFVAVVDSAHTFASRNGYNASDFTIASSIVLSRLDRDYFAIKGGNRRPQICIVVNLKRIVSLTPFLIQIRTKGPLLCSVSFWLSIAKNGPRRGALIVLDKVGSTGGSTHRKGESLA